MSSDKERRAFGDIYFCVGDFGSELCFGFDQTAHVRILYRLYKDDSNLRLSILNCDFIMPKNQDVDYKGIIGVLLGVGAIIGGIVALNGYTTRCSECNRWFSKRTVNKDVIKEEPGARDIERTDKKYDKDGKYEGMVKRKERIYGKNITYDVTIQCTGCSSQYH